MKNLGVSKTYKIPKTEFENVLMEYLSVESEILREKNKFSEEEQDYEYRPRGLYDCEPPSVPYPEVVDYKENEDGTILLVVNAVYPEENSPKAFVHEVVIRVLAENKFQYISNKVIPAGNNLEAKWHVPRLMGNPEQTPPPVGR